MAFVIGNYIPDAVKTYHKYSRTPFFGLLIVLVLLVIYEASSAMIYYEAASMIKKNVAETMIKRVFWYFGFQYNFLNWLAYAALLAWAFVLARKQQMLALQPVYFPYAIFESLTYALILGSMVNLMSRGALFHIKFLGQVSGDMSAATKMAQAMGAGIYEELLFRFFILTALQFLFQYTLVHTKPVVRQALELFISAGLFSAYHFLDVGGAQTMTLSAFCLRFYAGLILGVIFLWRGLGVAAYTHAFYDLFLVLQRS
ncbi:MAG: CPBP family intramembrane glutamic endopeptidase [candidate division KSB1 bacterium]